MIFKKRILTIQDISFQVLLEKREEDPNLFFRMRKKNKGECTLENGYFLPGGKHYVLLNFWDNVDIKDSANPVSLQITDKKDSYLKLNSYNNPNLESFFKIVREKIDGFNQIGSKPVWHKVYEGSFFRRTLEKFIEEDKKILDQLIQDHQPENIGFFDEEVFNERFEEIIEMRTKFLEEQKESEAVAG